MVAPFMGLSLSACRTMPTAAANRVALTACGPTSCFTTRALNAALYSAIGPRSPSYDVTMTDADAPLMRQLS
jgi:hypothetical protein